MPGGPALTETVYAHSPWNLSRPGGFGRPRRGPAAARGGQPDHAEPERAEVAGPGRPRGAGCPRRPAARPALTAVGGENADGGRPGGGPHPHRERPRGQDRGSVSGEGEIPANGAGRPVRQLVLAEDDQLR